MTYNVIEITSVVVVQDLMRSIPRDYKGGVMKLGDVGFKGFKLKELTPNKTRRAQVSCHQSIIYVSI